VRTVGIGEIPTAAERARIVNVFAKGQVPLDGLVRGWRTTLLTDSDLNTRPARAVLGALVASVVGDPAIYAFGRLGLPPGTDRRRCGCSHRARLDSSEASSRSAGSSRRASRA
jgi:hypothetical protein